MVEEEEHFTKSVQLTKDEQDLLGDESFTDFVRESLKNKKKKNIVISKKQKINKVIANGVYLIIGVSLLSAVNFNANVLTIGILGGLGAFFCIIGGYNLYLAFKEADFYSRP
jgi:hypothetical protein